MYRIGIDVGGTFTDVTLLNSETGAYYTYKLSSTLHDQSEAIANGTKETLALYGVPVEQLEYFGHGTTVATNMIIERKGAKTSDHYKGLPGPAGNRPSDTPLPV